MRRMSLVGVLFGLGAAACSGSGGSSGGEGGLFNDGGTGGGGLFGGFSSGGSSSGGSSSGGSSSGGSSSGGSSSGGSSSGGGQCVSTGKPACDACIDKNCCNAVRACGSDAQCSGLVACLGACAQGDSACSDACLQRFPSGKTPLQTVLSCVDQSCTGAC